MNVLSQFAKQRQLPESFFTLAKHVYLPIANQLAVVKQQRPFFVGINGCQGSGKSTMADFIAYYLSHQSRANVLVMSLDDFYFSGAERQQLATQIHPLLATRGVPGTHHIDKLSDVLIKLANRQVGFAIPRFNKATDEPELPENWQYVEKSPDIVLLEGWCWGTQPQTLAQLTTPVNALEQQYDQDGRWRHYVNDQLKQFYLPLYVTMQRWIYLQAPSFDCVYQWRLQQEHQLKQNTKIHNKIMSDEQIAHFISYFQRLTEHSFTCMPNKANDLIKLTPERNIAAFEQRFGG